MASEELRAYEADQACTALRDFVRIKMPFPFWEPLTHFVLSVKNQRLSDSLEEYVGPNSLSLHRKDFDGYQEQFNRMTEDQASPDKLVRKLAESMLPFDAYRDSYLWDALQTFTQSANSLAGDLNRSEVNLRDIVRSIRCGCSIDELDDDGGEASIEFEPRFL